MRLAHLGESGLSVTCEGVSVDLDPPRAEGDAPAILTWTETERVAGVRAGRRPVAAAAEVLAWLGVEGTSLVDGVEFGGFTLRATPYPPIPYATPEEALRKTRSALRDPLLALQRLAHTVRRPRSAPLVIELTRNGSRVLVLGQALHRFLPHDVLDRLLVRHAEPDVLVAGTDYEDEEATGRLMGLFRARHTVLIDAIGPVRRRLGLPVRPLSACLEHAPEGTLTLIEGGELTLTIPA